MKRTKKTSSVNEVKDVVIQSLMSDVKKALRRDNKKDELNATMMNLLLDVLKMIVVSELKGELMNENGKNGKVDKSDEHALLEAHGIRLEESLQKINQKLTEIDLGLSPENSGDAENISLEDLDDIDLATIEKLEEKGVRVVFPNLKYRKPKYKNVESVLKYVESEKDDKGGVKLVIMNFND